ncbi:MAG: transcription elongation factor GreA [Thermodesulfobacteriota bacterium]
MHKLPAAKQLEEKLKKLERELRIDIPIELKNAAAHGDLRENAEYTAAKERQSYLQARIAQIQSRISSLSSINLNAIPRDRVGFGTKVTVEDINNGDLITYELITPEEINPKEGKISLSSPIGAALLNKAVGDEVKIKLPAAVKEYVISDIVTLHQILKGE